MKKLVATAILTLTSSSLFATTISHQGLDWTRAMSIEIRTDGTTRNASAGVGQLLINGDQVIDAFCVNLFQGISLYSNYSATSVAPNAYDADGGTAAWLMRTFLPQVDTAIEGAALQLAIWDVIHDGGDGFNAGRVRSSANTNSSVLALATQWENASSGMTANGSAYVFTAATGARAFQQQIYLNAGGMSDVPEPGTMAMLAIGFAGVAVGSWRRKAAK